MAWAESRGLTAIGDGVRPGERDDERARFDGGERSPSPDRRRRGARSIRTQESKTLP